MPNCTKKIIVASTFSSLVNNAHMPKQIHRAYNPCPQIHNVSGFFHLSTSVQCSGFLTIQRHSIIQTGYGPKTVLRLLCCSNTYKFAEKKHRAHANCSIFKILRKFRQIDLHLFNLKWYQYSSTGFIDTNKFIPRKFSKKINRTEWEMK